MSVSVLVLTLNEEFNIGACLDSVRWSDDVVVLDSGSADRTLEIARGSGARVFERRFDDYASQRNFGLRGITYRNAWVLMLDADERVPPELGAEIIRATQSVAANVVLCRMRRKDHLFGRWIRGSSGYPTWFGRLVRLGHVWVERPINEEYRADGDSVNLEGHLEHFPFNKGFAAWLEKHDRYSSMEAELRANGARPRVGIAGLWHSDAGMRRRTLKALAYRLPARPLLMFAALYLLRGGVLEGRAGLTFSLLRAWYEFMIDCKYTELIRRRQSLPV